jgi:hypothetical protein
MQSRIDDRACSRIEMFSFLFLASARMCGDMMIPTLF